MYRRTAHDRGMETINSFHSQLDIRHNVSMSDTRACLDMYFDKLDNLLLYGFQGHQISKLSNPTRSSLDPATIQKCMSKDTCQASAEHTPGEGSPPSFCGSWSVCCQFTTGGTPVACIAHCGEAKLTTLIVRKALRKYTTTSQRKGEVEKMRAWQLCCATEAVEQAHPAANRQIRDCSRSR